MQSWGGNHPGRGDVASQLLGPRHTREPPAQKRFTTGTRGNVNFMNTNGAKCNIQMSLAKLPLHLGFPGKGPGTPRGVV